MQTKLDYKPALFADGHDDYKHMLERDDIDAVFVTTPTVFHGPMGAASLRAKKWVFSEVPACNTIEEGWDLIHAAEESGKGYFMAENYCFTRHNLLVLNMVEKGLFKTFTFAECGYIHEARDLQFNPDGTLNWRGRLNSSTELIGNSYPTHSLGPVSMWLGITRGARMLRATTMMIPLGHLPRNRPEALWSRQPRRQGDHLERRHHKQSHPDGERRGHLAAVRCPVAAAAPHELLHPARNRRFLRR